MPFSPCQAADTASFGYQCQDVDNVTLGCAPPIENRSFRLSEGPITRRALIALATRIGLTKLLDVLFRLLALKPTLP
jgi:hypothetical protein